MFRVVVALSSTSDWVPIPLVIKTIVAEIMMIVTAVRLGLSLTRTNISVMIKSGYFCFRCGTYL